MECVKFEQFGLMYAASELDGPEAAEYEAHLAECACCRSEVELYKKERESLFTEDLLGEAPSEAADREILRVCADPRKQFSMGLLFTFIKKYAPVPVFLMLIMVAVGGYVRYHLITVDNLHERYMTSSEKPADSLDIQPPIDYSDIAKADSAATDTQPARPFQLQRMDGVIPVRDSGD